MEDKKIMEEFQEILKKATTDRTVLRNLKTLIVKAQRFELAAWVRELEVKSFPPSEDDKLASKVSGCLAMVDIKCDDPTAWKIYMAIKTLIEKGEEFSIKDAAEIKAKAQNLEDS